MAGGVTDREGPEAAAAVHAWVASVLGKHSFAWQPEVTWDAERRGCTIRFRFRSPQEDLSIDVSKFLKAISSLLQQLPNHGACLRAWTSSI